MIRLSTKSKYTDLKEVKYGDCSLPHVIEDLNKVQTFLQEESDITSQSEEFFEEPFETPKSSSSSVKIKPGKARGVRLAEFIFRHISNTVVDDLQEDQEMKKAKERNAEQNVITEFATSNISHSFSLEQNSEDPREISVSHGQPSLSAVSSRSTVISSSSICAKKENSKEKVPTEEKQNTSETARHMLQDEMFKLVQDPCEKCFYNVTFVCLCVQLQQINFMSLMQILQSTFANLPNVQQTLQQYQSSHLEGIQPVHRAEVNASGRPSCSASASLKTQLSTEEDKGKYDQKSSDFQPTNSSRDESNYVLMKNHQNASVSSSLPESRSRETGFMPPSQDFHSSASIKPFHLLTPSADVQKVPKFIPIEKKTSYSDGFPLLKLESGYHCKPAFLHPIEMSSAFARPPPIRRVAWSSHSLWNYQSSYKERKSKSAAHLNVSRCNPEISRQMQEEEKRWAETVHKLPSKHLCSSECGEQEVSLDQQFPDNDVKMDDTVIAHDLAGIPLLHLNHDPVSRLLPVTRQPITTTSVPIKPVTEQTDCRETLQRTGISLLHACLPQQKKVLGLVIHYSELQEVPKLIPPQDVIAFEQYYHHHTVTSTSSGQDQIKPIQLLKTDVKPFEPRDVQNILKLSKDIGISTETEICDLGKSESVTSESSSVPKLSSTDMYLNQRFPSGVEEKLLPSSSSHAPVLNEHKYISVIDIEDSDILNDLPMIPESADEIVTAEQNEKFEIPSTGDVHHMAPSVTNADPSELLPKKDNHLKDVSSQMQKEQKETDSARESVTWNIDLDARTFPSTRLLPKAIGKEYVPLKHQEIDMLLHTLQDITKTMEEDFRNTRHLVKIIEDLEIASSSPHACPSFSGDSRVIDDENYLKGIILEDVTDDEKESLKLEHPIPSYNTLEVNSSALTASASNFPSGIKSSSGFHLDGKLSERYIHDSAFRNSQKTEKEKKEIQAWMKKKQKERMREYMKKLDEQRQKERNPFNFGKSKRFCLFVCCCRGHPSSRGLSERSRTAARHCFGQKGYHFTPALGSTQSKGKNRPSFMKAYVMYLVKFYFLEVGAPILGETLRHTEENCKKCYYSGWLLFSSAAEYRVNRVSQQKPPAVAAAVQTEGFDPEADRDVESPWTVPDNIQRILEDTHDTLFQDSAPHTLSFSPVACKDADGISESTGSILSRLDWNAIEAMVADVEDT
ncbi:UNVERIFIED_CONTAM: hypothetical protein H355_006639 [Colinus virginianus]|nr:hypothetical protein H355_006639 [Colinus virginianus]